MTNTDIGDIRVNVTVAGCGQPMVITTRRADLGVAAEHVSDNTPHLKAHQ